MLLPILIHVHNYTKINALIWGKLRHCQTAKTCSTYMRSFSHRRKWGLKDTATTDDDLRLDERCALFVALG